MWQKKKKDLFSRQWGKVLQLLDLALTPSLWNFRSQVNLFDLQMSFI